MTEDNTKDTPETETSETEEVSGEVREEEAAEAKLPPHITYDDFAKLDIRIGTITAIDVVENADKLLKLTVDLGEEKPRQIISGIREYFADPQELVGRQCPFVANLEPRVIRGLESQGMIMAASTLDNTFALLNPHVELPAGTKVN